MRDKWLQSRLVGKPCFSNARQCWNIWSIFFRWVSLPSRGVYIQIAVEMKRNQWESPKIPPEFSYCHQHICIFFHTAARYVCVPTARQQCSSYHIKRSEANSIMGIFVSLGGLWLWIMRPFRHLDAFGEEDYTQSKPIRLDVVTRLPRLAEAIRNHNFLWEHGKLEWKQIVFVWRVIVIIIESVYVHF